MDYLAESVMDKEYKVIRHLEKMVTKDLKDVEDLYELEEIFEEINSGKIRRKKGVDYRTD